MKVRLWSKRRRRKQRAMERRAMSVIVAEMRAISWRRRLSIRNLASCDGGGDGGGGMERLLVVTRTVI